MKVSLRVYNFSIWMTSSAKIERRCSWISGYRKILPWAHWVWSHSQSWKAVFRHQKRVTGEKKSAEFKAIKMESAGPDATVYSESRGAARGSWEGRMIKDLRKKGETCCNEQTQAGMRAGNQDNCCAQKLGRDYVPGTITRLESTISSNCLQAELQRPAVESDTLQS